MIRSVNQIPEYHPVGLSGRTGQTAIMEFAAQRRQALTAFMERENLKPAPWEKAAQIGDGTVRKFLAGQSGTLTDRTYQRLADAAASILGRAVVAAELQGAAAAPAAQSSADTATGSQQFVHNRVSSVPFGTPPLVPAPQRLIVFLAVAGDGRRGNTLIHKKKVGETERPKFLEFAAEAFAFDAADDVMSPAFRTRDTLLINPESAPADGDDCLFVKAGSKDPMDALGRHLVKATASTWTVRQYNPRKDVELARADYPQAWPIVAIYKRR